MGGGRDVWGEKSWLHGLILSVTCLNEVHVPLDLGSLGATWVWPLHVPFP